MAKVKSNRGIIILAAVQVVLLLFLLPSCFDSGKLFVWQISNYQVSWNGRMLFCSLLCLFLALDGMVLMHGKIAAGRISTGQQAAFWVLLGCLVLTCLPYLADYLPCGDRIYANLSHIEWLKAGFTQEGRSGFGEWGKVPGGIFLLIPALVRLIGFSPMTAYKVFVIGIMEVTVLVTYFSFRKCSERIYGALCGSVLYILAYGRLDAIYGKAALDEGLAMIFFPLLFSGVYLLYTENAESAAYSHHKWKIIVGIFLIQLCSPFLAVVSAIFIALAGLVMWKVTIQKPLLTQWAEIVVFTFWSWILVLPGGFSASRIPAGEILSVVAAVGLPMVLFILLEKYRGRARTGTVWFFTCAAGILLVGIALYQMNCFALRQSGSHVYAVEAVFFDGRHSFQGTESIRWGEILQRALVHIVSFACSFLLFQRLFTKDRLSVWCGVVLYMTLPYRLYLCYDKGDLLQAGAWALLPLYVWAVFTAWSTASGALPQGEASQKKNRVRIWGVIALAGAVIAGIGYMDMMLFLTVFGLTLLAALCGKKASLLLVPAVGACLCAPRLLRLMQYLFTDKYADLNLPLNSIMDDGYNVADIFSVFFYRAGRPGLGLGLLIGIVAAVWLAWVRGVWRNFRGCGFFIGVSVLLLIFSTRYFPWDFVERLGMWALKLVSLFETPALFFGLAGVCLCIPAAWAVKLAGEQEEKLLSRGIPWSILLSSVAIAAVIISV